MITRLRMTQHSTLSAPGNLKTCVLFWNNLVIILTDVFDNHLFVLLSSFTSFKLGILYNVCLTCFFTNFVLVRLLLELNFLLFTYLFIYLLASYFPFPFPLQLYLLFTLRVSGILFFFSFFLFLFFSKDFILYI